VTVARHIQQAGHEVVGHDPAVAPDHAAQAIPGIRLYPTVEEAATGADAIVVGTDWPLYGEVDWDGIAPRMRGNVVFDGRNVLDRAAVVAAGLRYRGVGRPSLEPAAASHELPAIAHARQR
jgi:UDPglucose 6-dehydrogenase